MMVRGSVDVLTETEVIGWAFSPGRNTPVLVQAVLNHEILGEAEANVYRADLAEAGLGDGNSGYFIKLFRSIDPIYFPFIVIKVDGGDAELPRAPMLGYAEFFRSLHAAHPVAGRSRSVFGGLWTDRTDAAALLRGKVAIGQIEAAVSHSLERLIHDGFTIVDLQSSPVMLARRESLADLQEDGALLAVLRAALEDNPLTTRCDLIPSGETGLSQPSAGNLSPSPAECLEVIVTLGDLAVLDVVRDSHRLPEFSSHGTSRWASGATSDAIAVVGLNGLIQRLKLPVGQAAVVGPGTIYRVSCVDKGCAQRSLCVPSRALPMTWVPANGQVGGDAVLF